MTQAREARTPHGRFVVVAFDITDDRRRRRFARGLTAFGVRTQFSVFECVVRGPDRLAFEQFLAAGIDPEQDRVSAYVICDACRPRCEQLGAPLQRLPDDWIVE